LTGELTEWLRLIDELAQAVSERLAAQLLEFPRVKVRILFEPLDDMVSVNL
jgi:hypothetical protein